METLRASVKPSGDDRRATFVASTADVVRDGLRVLAEGWDVRHFRRNPVLLWAHDSRGLPIGRVTEIGVRNGELIAEVEAPPEGAYEFADTVWRFIKRGLLNAVSVGFRPTEVSKDGSTITKAELLELSVVPVPADPNALAVARAIAPKSADHILKGVSAEDADGSDSRRQARHEPAPTAPKAQSKGGSVMSDLTERLAGLESKLAETEDKIDRLVETSEQEDRDFDSAEEAQYEEMKREASVLKARIARINEREKERAAVDAKPVEAARSSYGGAKPRVKVGHQQRAPGTLPMSIARAKFRAGGHVEMAAEFAERDGDPELAAILRADAAPATMTTSGWADDLVNDQMGQFLDLLRPKSIFARVEGNPITLGRNGSVTLPALTTGISGGFFKEGDPIPVKQGATGSVVISPYQLGVITVATKKLLQHSTPDADRILMNSMLQDTAVALDGVFVDNNAAVSNERPRGLQKDSGTASATAAGTVSTAAEIEADITGLLSNMEAINAPMERLVFIMTPGNARKLAHKQNSGGFYPFKDEVSAGRFFGGRLLLSNTAASDVVLVVDEDLLYKANLGLPEVSISDQAVLHMEDTDPKAIGFDDTGATVAEPVRSMFQTDSVAMKLVFPTGWVRRADAASQSLTGVAW